MGNGAGIVAFSGGRVVIYTSRGSHDIIPNRVAFEIVACKLITFIRALEFGC